MKKSSRILQCTKCNARFENLLVKNRHEANEEFVTGQQKACHKCDFVSCTFDDLLKHLTIVHKSVSDLAKHHPERFGRKTDKKAFPTTPNTTR